MIIRQARLSDAAQLARVHVDTWRSTYGGLIPDDYLDRLDPERGRVGWERWLSDAESGRFAVVAEDPSRGVVGFAYAGPARAATREGPPSTAEPAYSGELYAIYILAPHQRRGTGRLLMRAVVEALLREDLTSMMVWVLAANPARAFYESLGGRECGRQRVNIGGAELEEVAYGWDDVNRILDPGPKPWAGRNGEGGEPNPR